MRQEPKIPDVLTVREYVVNRVILKDHGLFAVHQDQEPVHVSLDDYRGMVNKQGNRFNADLSDTRAVFREFEGKLLGLKKSDSFRFPYAINEFDVTELSEKFCFSDLKTSLQEGADLRYYDSMSGVVTPWTYFGSAFSIFAFHNEDGNTFSSNLQLSGDPKIWIFLEPGQARELEGAIRALYPQYSDGGTLCNDYLRHKSCFFTLSQLKQFGMRYTVVVQNPGEMIVTMPYAIHGGFNTGENCNVAVNMAAKSWLPYGLVAKTCACLTASAVMPMRFFVELYLPRDIYKKYVGTREKNFEDREEILGHDDQLSLPQNRYGSSDPAIVEFAGSIERRQRELARLKPKRKRKKAAHVPTDEKKPKRNKWHCLLSTCLKGVFNQKQALVTHIRTMHDWENNPQGLAKALSDLGPPRRPNHRFICMPVNCGPCHGKRPAEDVVTGPEVHESAPESPSGSESDSCIPESPANTEALKPADAEESSSDTEASAETEIVSGSESTTDTEDVSDQQALEILHATTKDLHALRSDPLYHPETEDISPPSSPSVLHETHDDSRKWIDDSTIHFFLNHLMSQNQNIHAFDIFFYNHLHDKGIDLQLLRWTRRVDIFSKEFIFFPVNLKEMHWTLIVANCKEKTISYYDSMGGGRVNMGCCHALYEPPSHHMDRVLQYLQREHEDKKGSPLPSVWTCNPVGESNDVHLQDGQIPQQENTYDCGVFLCKFADCISRGLPFSFSQRDMPEMRNHLKHVILSLRRE